jgi:hypothetical protein
MRSLSVLFAAAFILQACSVSKNTAAGNENPVVEKIWDQAPHNAFTDLIRFKGAFYCAFREAQAHVSGADGKARILRSKDGKTWESIALLEVKDRDIRDPKLSVTPENRIMVLMDIEAHEGKKVISRKPLISLSNAAGDTFSTPEGSSVDPAIASWSDWVWRLTWHKGTGYAILYQQEKIYLVSTKDGRYFQHVSQLVLDGRPNESAIRFDNNDKMYVVIRRESGDQMGVVATAAVPYKEWNFAKMDYRIGGPDFLFLDQQTLVIGTRQYVPKVSTVIYVAGLDGKVRKTIPLPSGGDTSYPGMLIWKGQLWASYYSSHEGKSSIYIARVPLQLLGSK